MDKHLEPVRAIDLAFGETQIECLKRRGHGPTRFGDYGGYKGMYDLSKEDIFYLCEKNGRDYVWDYVRRNNPDNDVDFDRLMHDNYYRECLDKARYVRTILIEWLNKQSSAITDNQSCIDKDEGDCICESQLIY